MINKIQLDKISLGFENKSSFPINNHKSYIKLNEPDPEIGYSDNSRRAHIDKIWEIRLTIPILNKGVEITDIAKILDLNLYRNVVNYIDFKNRESKREKIKTQVIRNESRVKTQTSTYKNNCPDKLLSKAQREAERQFPIKYSESDFPEGTIYDWVEQYIVDNNIGVQIKDLHNNIYKIYINNCWIEIHPKTDKYGNPGEEGYVILESNIEPELLKRSER